MIDTEQARTLLQLARAAISSEWQSVRTAPTDAAWLQTPAATFVTLTQDGELRGCIGSLEPRRSLRDDVQYNARAAAFHDSRFAPLREDELPHTQIEISLLSPMQPLTFTGEADALAQLQPGIDGLVFEFGRFRSTFLPQVWEQLPHPEEFLAHLKAKAGLTADFWSDEVQLHRYRVSKFTDASVNFDNTPAPISSTHGNNKELQDRGAATPVTR